VARDDDRAYVDHPIGDLDAATRVARAAADRWRLAPPVLVRRGMNAIFVSGDVVLRAASPSVPADASLRLAEHLRRSGLRVPVARRDDVVVEGPISVTAWERIEDTGGRIDWSDVGGMVRLVHGLDADALPDGVPLPHPSALPWWDFDALVARAGSALDEQARDGLLATVERHRGWDQLDELVVCHGDVHPGNVLAGPDGPVLLDWDLLCRAPAGWDHAPLLTWHDRWGGDAAIYDEFATGYGRSFVDDPAAVAFAELRLVAATLMRVLASIDDPRARPEAERRLRYWRGERDAPPWTAQ
jgi:Phosphotransferase enzyme family